MDEHGNPAAAGLRRGVATGPAERLRSRALGAWDALLELADGRPDLGVLADLGSWPERPVLERLLAQARGGPRGGSGAGRGARVDHSRAGREEILAALAEARVRVRGALDETDADPRMALAELDSALGPLPLLTQIHAMGHELALAALRLPAGPGAAPVPEAVTDAGVAALVDVVGALAHRQGLRAAAGVWGGGTRGWTFRADPDGWTTEQGAGGVPGLPGGALLRRTVGVVGLLGRLPGMR